MWRIVPVLILAVLLLGGGCKSNESPRDAADPDPADVEVPEFDDEGADPEAVVSAVGTVRYVDLEGGFYGIETDEGEQYLPQNLPEEYQQDGLRVRFRGRILEDVMTAQMWGQPVELFKVLQVAVDDD